MPSTSGQPGWWGNRGETQERVPVMGSPGQWPTRTADARLIGHTQSHRHSATPGGSRCCRGRVSAPSPEETAPARVGPATLRGQVHRTQPAVRGPRDDPDVPRRAVVDQAQRPPAASTGRPSTSIVATRRVTPCGSLTASLADGRGHRRGGELDRDHVSIQLLSAHSAAYASRYAGLPTRRDHAVNAPSRYYVSVGASP